MTVITYTITAGGKATIPKDPQARKLYGVDLVDVLAEANTTIASAVIGEVAGVAVDGAVSIVGTVVAAWVTGGTLGQEGHVTFRYTLSDGSIDDITLYFDIRQR